MATPSSPDPVVLGATRLTRDRAQAALGPWIAQLASWDYYVTLTYDPDRPGRAHGPPSIDTSRHHVESWLDELLASSRTFVLGALALEYHKNGWPHWHGLVATGRAGHGLERALYHPWYRLYGYARVEAIRPNHAKTISAYCAKYLVKDGGTSVIDWRPRGLTFGAIESLAGFGTVRQTRLS